MSRLFKSVLLVVLLAGAGAAGFGAGRFTAPAPRFESDRAGSGDLAAAWSDFIRAQEQALQMLQAHAFYGDEQERAEAYRGVLYGTVGAIRTGALMEHDHPRFMRAADWTSKSGLDNPDNNYYAALVRDDADYLVTGTRGSTRNLIFQLVVGQPGVRGAGSSTNVSVLYGRDIEFDPDGGFQVLVSPRDPGPGVNWLPSGDGAETLLVRHTHSDWAQERVGELTIRRLDREGEPIPVLSEARMAEKLRDAAASLYDRTATWLKFSEKAWALMPRNDIAAARPSRGGLVGQYSAFGSWELPQEEALVISVAPAPADYQGIELGNLWFVSLDYETRTSSLTLDQAHRSSDGLYHFVLSRRDPGIQNWLDPEDHARGLIMMRWQGLAGEFGDALQPRVRRVPLSGLSTVLPADTPRFSEAQRREQIATRRFALLRRFQG